MRNEEIAIETTLETKAGSVPQQAGRRVAFLLPSLEGGGAERTVVKMLREMNAADIQLDLVLTAAHGLYLEQIPKKVRVIDLRARRVAEAVIPLSRYLLHSRPPVLISNMAHLNAIACLAKTVTNSKTAIICVEHAHIDIQQSLRGKVIQALARLVYPKAGAIVGVSRGVGRSVENVVRSLQGKVEVIYPPVVDDILLAEAAAPLTHSWFTGEIPIFLAVGRLSGQKDFSTLLKAFHQVRRQRMSRLMILGEGPDRGLLEAEISALELSEDVAMPGFVANPYAYMSRASAFVLSSRFEGMPAVLIEAMACGCPVIAMDCPSGPSEILDGGRFGPLVPIGHAASLASAMSQTLDAPISAETLRRRAMQFSTAQATNAFLDLAARLTGAAPSLPKE